MRFLVCLVLLCVSLVASKVDSEELYGWVDETGKVHIVDEINRVPERYRQDIMVFPTSSGPEKMSPVKEGEVFETGSKTPGKQEQPESSTLAAKEKAKSVEGLRQEKEKLELERHRQRVLQRRFGGARATLYGNKIQQLDQELDVIQKKLDALRTEDQ